MNTVGVLAPTIEAAREVIRIDPLFGSMDRVVPLSPQSAGHRGLDLTAIFVEPGVNLSDRLVGELAPCLMFAGGTFYRRMTSGGAK